MQRGATMLLLAACAAGCAHRPDALVTITCPVPSARIYVDDRLIGSAVAPRSWPLGAGTHRVELRADGYYDAYRTVEVRPQKHTQTLPLDADLRPIPDGADPY